ncbi:helix-turn-helix domain-containing protein [Streptomyces sp. NPDC004266]|uniref:AlbA family DNA-binding domain-containing protein n=1 Tax=Streptomyces sp. NPDC004266 TaxID=3364693 RepID=UPI00369AFD77
MDHNSFEALLSRPEGPTLDFKRSFYRLRDGDHAKKALVKDILAMANTPREETAYIVFGVRELNGRNIPEGIDGPAIDDANLQTLVASYADPCPPFTYEQVAYKDRTFGVIAIPLQRDTGPYMAVKRGKGRSEEGFLAPETIYFRRGSSNTEAGPADQKWVYSWFLGNDRDEPVLASDVEQSWKQFRDTMRSFSTDRRYLLVAPPLHDVDDVALKGLALQPWSAVIDLDPRSEDGGFLGSVEQQVRSARSLHMVSPEDREMALGGQKSVQWIFACGIDTVSITEGEMPFRDWKTRYSAHVNGRFRELAAALRPAPVVCLLLSYGGAARRISYSVIENLLENVGESLQVIVCTDDPTEHRALEDDFDAVVIPIPLTQLGSGLAGLEDSASGQHGDRMLPSLSGAPIPLPHADAPWIEEELELLYLGTRWEDAVDRVEDAFLKGWEISWPELGRRLDVDRSATAQIHHEVIRALGQRGLPLTLNIWHSPGAGGTTVARRILWDLHRIYPCAVLRGNRSARNGAHWVAEVAERIMRVAQTTGRSVLLLAEASQVPASLISELFNVLRSKHVSAVVLQVLRQVNGVHGVGKQTYRVSSELDDEEAARFAEVYSSARPERADEISLLQWGGVSDQRTPFHFGLTAFDRQFRGIGRYVQARIDALDEKQREVILHIALGHHYGQQSLPAQLFAETFAVPAWKPVDLFDHLPDHALDLIIEEPEGAWRTAHALFAEEIVTYILGQRSGGAGWTSALADAAIAFAELCRGHASMPGDLELDLMQRVFIYRDSGELLGTERAGNAKFSKLVEDIKLPNAGGRVLEKVASLFPEQPHFHAHLARYQAFELKTLPAALQSIQRAIKLQEGDSLLHHMHGMILRGEVYDLIRRRVDVRELENPVQSASDAFARSREIRRDNEHGYISEVQMLIRVVDYLRQHYSQELSTAVASVGSGALGSALERAEDLLAQALVLKENPSKFVLTCDAQLHNLYGDHQLAIDTYRRMLERDDVDLPSVRRQLVWTYLHKNKRQWESVKDKDMKRIEDLLRTNLREATDDGRTMRLWLQAARFVPNPPGYDELIEQLDMWRAANPSLEVAYYLYIVNMLKYLETDSGQAKTEAARYVQQCSQRTLYSPDRHKSFEWMGPGKGLRRLVHQSRLGEWDAAQNFFMNSQALSRVEARVTKYIGPQSGELSIGGVTAFYVPARADHQFRSLHQKVTCYVGFSYEGLRAWEVRDLQEDAG